MKQVRRGDSPQVATLLDVVSKRKRSLKSKVKPRSLSTVGRSKVQSNPKRTSKRPAMPKKKSGSKRKRDKRGHFISKARKAARRGASANPRKRTAKKRTAKKRKSGTVRIKRALGRKKTSGRFTRRAKHRVRGYRRKVKGRSAKRLVRSHLSYENPIKRKRRRTRRATEATMAQANPRRRKRRAPKRRRAAAVMENPRPRKRRRAAAPRKRRRAAAAYAPNPVKKRRRARRSVTAAVPAIIRRRSSKRGGRSTRAPGRIVVQIAGLGRRPAKRRSSAKRKSSSKRRKGASKRKSAKRKSKYTRKSHQLGMGGPDLTGLSGGFFENPMGGNFLENPLSGGELALAALTGTIGYALTDLLDRYLAVKAYAGGPSTATNTAGAINGVVIQPSAAVRTKPGITRILAQAAAAAVPLGLAYWVREPMGRAALQGAGIGALMHLGGQLVNHWVMTWLGTKSTMIKPLYQMEVQADSFADVYDGKQPVGYVSGQLAGLTSPRAPNSLGAPPKGLGRPNVLRRPVQPSIPFSNPGPFAVAGVANTIGATDVNGDPMSPVDDSCSNCAPTDEAGIAALVVTSPAVTLGAPPADAAPARFNGLGSLDMFGDNE
jgi:hypothetical protein